MNKRLKKQYDSFLLRGLIFDNAEINSVVRKNISEDEKTEEKELHKGLEVTQK